MKIIVAGSDTRNVSQLCVENKLVKLYSILNEKKLIEDWNDDNLLMVDSGAHSYNKVHDHFGMASKTKLIPAIEHLENYFQFIKKHKEKKVIWVELDVYQDLDISIIDDFYKRVMDLGIAGKFIRVYHPYIDPAKGDYTNLHKWIGEGQDFIGMGADNMDDFDDIFSITKNDIKLHGFALTRLNVIEKYPFWSVDSTSPLSTVIFGRYSRPILAFKERDDVFKEKSIECFDDDYVRIRKAVIETKKTEDYITELWKKRGVIWQDLKF